MLLSSSRCLLCHASSKVLLCPSCTDSLPYLKPPFCERCAIPLPTQLSRPLCRLCREHPRRFRFQSLGALFLYREPIKTLLLQLKFGKKTYIAKALAPLMAARLLQPEKSFPPPKSFAALIPIPIAPARVSKRWFNQTEVFAEELEGYLELPTKKVLQRTQWHPKPQSRLPITSRRANVQRAFQATAPLEKRDYLLLDDVATSGETLSAAAAALLKGGARSVYAFALCRGGTS